MSTPRSDQTCIDKPTEAAQIAHGSGPVPLTELELDCVAGAGSKPGMVGDGRQSLQFQQMR